MADFTTGPFGGIIFWQIFDFLKKKKKKKSLISDIALCVLCMLVLHGDLQVIHGDLHLFSTLHCSWCVSEYKSRPSCSKLMMSFVNVSFKL